MLIKSKIADALPKLIERVEELENRVEKLEQTQNIKPYEEIIDKKNTQVKKTVKKESK